MERGESSDTHEIQKGEDPHAHHGIGPLFVDLKTPNSMQVRVRATGEGIHVQEVNCRINSAERGRQVRKSSTRGEVTHFRKTMVHFETLPLDIPVEANRKHCHTNEYDIVEKSAGRSRPPEDKVQDVVYDV